MSKGDGGGVNIRFGRHGQNATGDKRPKLKQATKVDSHLNEKAARNLARKIAEGKHRPKKEKLTAAERKAEKLARERLKSAPRNVEVEYRKSGQVASKRTVKRA